MGLAKRLQLSYCMFLGSLILWWFLKLLVVPENKRKFREGDIMDLNKTLTNDNSQIDFFNFAESFTIWVSNIAFHALSPSLLFEEASPLNVNFTSPLIGYL